MFGKLSQVYNAVFGAGYKDQWSTSFDYQPGLVKQVRELSNKLDKTDELARELQDVDYSALGCVSWNKGLPPPNKPGIKSRIATLEKENKKLKAIVAELCDYVYQDKEDK